MFEEREPWRRDAEVACMKSGAVRENAGLVRIAPIEGPGICGADFPLRVATLGSHGAALGFSNEPPRPPGSIPGTSQPPWPIAQPRTFTPPPAQVYSPPPPANMTSPPTSSAAPPNGWQPQAGPPGAPLDLSAPDQQRTQSSASSSQPQLQTIPLGPPVPQYTGAVVPVELKPAATLACPLVSTLDQWVAQSVQPAARRWFGQQVVEIKQISAYSCRSMNNQRGGKISEHAFGNAIDVAAFVLADGRIVTVKNGWRGAAAEQGFLRDVQSAACEMFTTVLAPGADAYHYDHIHVDLMRRASGRRICQPAAVDGEAVAARVQPRNPSQPQYQPPSQIRQAPLNTPTPPRNGPADQRNDPFAWRGASVQRDDALVTGSSGAQRFPAQPSAPDRDWIEDDGPRPSIDVSRPRR